MQWGWTSMVDSGRHEFWQPIPVSSKKWEESIEYSQAPLNSLRDETDHELVKGFKSDYK